MLRRKVQAYPWVPRAVKAERARDVGVSVTGPGVLNSRAGERCPARGRRGSPTSTSHPDDGRGDGAGVGTRGERNGVRPTMTRFVAVFLLLLSSAARLHAQAASAPRVESDRCDDGVVSVVFIDNHSIFDTADPTLDGRFGWAYRLANALHVRTRREVIERELLVRPGDCHDPARLEESERLLRSYPFLSRVDVFSIRQPDGSHHVVVDTQDEWSTQLDVRVGVEDGLRFEGARLRELNLLGTGRTLEFFFLERDANQEYGVGYATPQLFRTRWDMALAAGRTRAGSFVRQTIAYPFVGEAGRWAARQTLRRQDRFFDYALSGPDEEHLLLPVREQVFELAVVGRSGEVGRLATFGAALGYIGLSYPGGASAIEHVFGHDYHETTLPGSDASAAVLRQMTELEALRLTFLLGRRGITWVKRRGFDSLRGAQDIALGSEVELALGASLPSGASGGGPPGAIAGLSFYGARELGNLLVASTLRLDGRLDHDAAEDARRWRDLYADGEVLAYWRPAVLARHTFVLRGAGAGGFQSRTPFQLTLGGDRGLRGFERYRFPGGRRVLFSLEDRVYFGWPFRDVLDLGGTLFFDLGRVWPGDAPFGVDSGWRAAAGLGLRGALPAGGRTTYRIDLAWPLTHGASWRDARLVLSIGELLGLSRTARAEPVPAFRQLGLTGQSFYFPQ